MATSTCILRGRRGTSVTGLGVAARLGTLVAAAVCMPGVALGDIDCGRPGTWPHRCAFWWQAWHLVTSTFILRGRRGTYGTGLALAARLGTLVAAAVCVAGVSLATSTVTLRGRRGTGRHRRAFCVAGVAFLALDWWRAWVLWSRRLFACQAWHLATLTRMLRGKRGKRGIYGITS